MKYADVTKTVYAGTEYSVTFNAREVYSPRDEDYDIVDVEVASVEMLGIDVDASNLPQSLLNKMIDEFADDCSAEWEYY
jgi:hypothetical protein